MQPLQRRYDTGIIVGRFQVATLHDEHRALIDGVKQYCDNVIIVLGLSPVPHSRNNPLDFQSRKAMIHESYPDVDVVFIKDHRDDKAWSDFLDNMIEGMVPRTHKVALFGSRDSFVNHYHGRYETVELDAERYVSGTEQRDRISRSVLNSPEFRAGQVFAAYGTFPTAFPTVDIIVFDEGKGRLLLGRKPGEEKYRFFGGFVDPVLDSSKEEAAIRELHEEAGPINVGGPSDLRYLGSTVVDDWRYRSDVNKIVTSIYQASYIDGKPNPGSDIAEVAWFDIKSVAQNLVDEHLAIWERIELVYP